MSRHIVVVLALGFMICPALRIADAQIDAKELGVDQNFSGAEERLAAIARISSGKVELSFFNFEKGGVYVRRTSPTLCAAKGMDPATFPALREEHDAKMVDHMELFQKVADADSSGSVSVAEGQKFAEAMFFGAKAAFIFENEGNSLSKTLNAMRMDRDEFDRNAESYHRYLEQMPDELPPFVFLVFAQSTQ
jgi:hypothetical protein